MAEEKSTDILGISGFAEATKVTAKGLVDGAGAFLGRICLPAAEEFGFLLRDKVAGWRERNLVALAQKTERFLGAAPMVHAPPRVALQILQNGSSTDDETLQNMWAGLLASACSTDGRDDSNLIFIGILSNLTSCQVRILNEVCISTTKRLSRAGLLDTDRNVYTAERLIEVTGVSDLHRLDREIDHLRALGVLSNTSGFSLNSKDKLADVTPSTLGLHMFARCSGSRESPEVFFGLRA